MKTTPENWLVKLFCLISVVSISAWAESDQLPTEETRNKAIDQLRTSTTRSVGLNSLREFACRGDEYSAYFLWQSYEQGKNGLPKHAALATRWKNHEGRLLAQHGSFRADGIPGVLANLPNPNPPIPDDPDLCPR